MAGSVRWYPNLLVRLYRLAVGIQTVYVIMATPALLGIHTYRFEQRLPCPISFVDQTYKIAQKLITSTCLIPKERDRLISGSTHGKT